MFDKERNNEFIYSRRMMALISFHYHDVENDISNVDDDNINNADGDDVDDDVDDDDDVEDDYYLHVSQLMLLTLTSGPRGSKFKYRELFRLYRRT